MQANHCQSKWLCTGHSPASLRVEPPDVAASKIHTQQPAHSLTPGPTGHAADPTAAHLCRARASSSRVRRFSARCRLCTMPAVRCRSPAALTEPSRKGSTTCSATWRSSALGAKGWGSSISREVRRFWDGRPHSDACTAACAVPLQAGKGRPCRGTHRTCWPGRAAGWGLPLSAWWSCGRQQPPPNRIKCRAHLGMPGQGAGAGLAWGPGAHACGSAGQPPQPSSGCLGPACRGSAAPLRCSGASSPAGSAWRCCCQAPRLGCGAVLDVQLAGRALRWASRCCASMQECRTPPLYPAVLASISCPAYEGLRL